MTEQPYYRRFNNLLKTLGIGRDDLDDLFEAYIDDLLMHEPYATNSARDVHLVARHMTESADEWKV